MKHWHDITLGEIVHSTRQKLKEVSPVWLNVEINREFFSNLKAALKRSPSTPHLEAQEPIALLPPAQNCKRLQQHKWLRRRLEVEAAIAAAWNAGVHCYNHLIEAVRFATGKGCSRRAIARWKREQGLLG
jgi:hypothetical protein